MISKVCFGALINFCHYRTPVLFVAYERPSQVDRLGSIPPDPLAQPKTIVVPCDRYRAGLLATIFYRPTQHGPIVICLGVVAHPPPHHTDQHCSNRLEVAVDGLFFQISLLDAIINTGFA